nr:helix-turn-helix transcriptional regulator [Aliikangiella coralliicola]
MLNHELVINFSEYYHFQAVKNGCALMANFQNPNAWINGIQTRPINIESKGKHEMMGVLFKAHGLKAFTKFHSGEFEQQFIDPLLIFGAGFNELVEKLYLEQNIQGRYEHLCEFLIECYIHTEMPKYLESCLHYFANENDQMVTVKNACDQFSISNKSLVSSFNKHIGITPLKFINLTRVNQAIRMLCNNPNQSLTELAFKLHYADQAHFTKSFKAAVGFSPSEYLQAYSNSRIESDAPNLIFQPG